MIEICTTVVCAVTNKQLKGTEGLFSAQRHPEPTPPPQRTKEAGTDLFISSPNTITPHTAPPRPPHAVAQTIKGASVLSISHPAAQPPRNRHRFP